MRTSALLQVLDLARWAPSGDNTQPWRFELVDDSHVVVHGHDTRDHCVYDLDGRPSQISIGAMIETAAIAATAHGLALHCERRADAPDTRPTFDLRLLPDPGVRRSALVECIPRRSVQRKPMPVTPLTVVQKQALEAAVGPAYRLHWMESPSQRSAMARLLFANAGIRLTMPEAFEVHRSVIQWGARYSADKVPSGALGVDRLSVAVMRFGLHSWQRVRFMNRYFGGTLLPRLQMDWWPALRCSAHVAIMADRPPVSIDDHVAAGRAMQRFWLTATSLGLHHQPAATPLVFSRYVREGRTFTSIPEVQRAAERLAPELDRMLEGRGALAVWLGRIGGGPPPTARSERLSLAELLVTR